MKGIYLLLGSNLGDRYQMLKRAYEEIEDSVGAVVKSSAIYATKAWGVEDQPDFLNQVIEVDSTFTPGEILKKVNVIEEKLGRVRKIKWHSRIIDIDILYYADLVLNTNELAIPHPGNEHRRFVLVPMVEIASEFTHPITLNTQEQLLEKCVDELEVIKA